MRSSVLVMLGILVFSPHAIAQEENVRLSTSRALAQQLASELSQALSAAMQAGGAVNAIEVCHDQAPGIAQRLSEKNDIVITRTSLKVRNPRNAPQAWQREVLERFQRGRTAGEELTTLEHFEPTAQGGARYMKAIGTQPLCLVCHGESIAPDVREALVKRYPKDAATGFRVGDLRGAFVVVWPATGKRGVL